MVAVMGAQRSSLDLGWFVGTRPWWRDSDRWATVEDSYEGDAIRFGLVVLLSADGVRVDGVALGRRAGRSDTFRKKVHFSEWIAFPPFPIADAIGGLTSGTRNSAITTTRGEFGGFTSKASAHLLAWMQATHPIAHAAVQTLASRIALPAWLTDSDAPGHRTYAEQYDGLRVGLAIAGFDRREALSRVPHPAEPADVQLASVLEDQIVVHDTQVFSDWVGVPHIVSGAWFEQPGTGRRLRTFLANKLPLERQTGADIVYYMEDFESFVLVQYKRCIRESQRLLYRPDDQHDREVDRLRKLQAASVNDLPADLKSHRIGGPFCFLKLCTPEQPLTADMAHGKYFDLHGFQLSLETGPKRGRRLIYDNAERYLNNTNFIDLVSQGWIGSSGGGSEKVMQVVEAALNNDRSVLLASVRFGDANPRGVDSQNFQSGSISI